MAAWFSRNEYKPYYTQKSTAQEMWSITGLTLKFPICPTYRACDESFTFPVEDRAKCHPIL